MNALADSAINQMRAALLDAVFPPRCAGCRALCERTFCGACAASLQPIMPPFCACCGFPFDTNLHHASICARCRDNRYHGAPSFEKMRSVFSFEGAIRHAVHRFKYENKTSLAAPLAALLRDFLQQSTEESDIPIAQIKHLVPVPLHSWRGFRRGYNQSELLARELGKLLDIPTANALRRVRHTTPQVELTRKQRRENVRDAFVLDNPLRAIDGAILLVDDVCTTGATLSECARVLKKGHNAPVYALTVARQL